MTRDEWIAREFPAASPMHADVRGRFLAKIDVVEGERSCWRWTAARNEWGYGVIRIAGRTAKAHRVALAMAIGRPPAPGLDICHACHDRRCCRPSHLREDTHAANLRESALAERMNPRGLRVSNEDASAIVAAVAAGEKQRDIAARHGIAPCTVSLIASGRRRPHVKRAA